MATEEGYIIEFVPMGNSVKVSAMDPETLTEVSIIGPRTAGQEELQRNVLNKLHYVLKKEKGGEVRQSTDKQSSKGGIIV
ncbi:hypothetical protein GUA87_08665 [Sneathiella sp. P13V-1]|uniref:DUF6898 family protein n=1 Tax=Sneathiella sp. P13V-1 TaxID=2697366 RepID=UPI00187B54FC|nr:hypothetical protein [Sneathiella sp. P13V-1]MBE7636915.1 hypothetical protein [Sneathiella sp. P13V-1]